MALTQISNATFDAALAAVPGPYGPLTRTGSSPATDLDALPRVEPNARTEFEVVGQGSVHFFISYEQLVNTDLLNDKLREAYGIKFRFNEAREVAETIFRYLDSVDPLALTVAQYQEYMRLWQYIVPIIGHLNPQHSFQEVTRANIVDAAFTTSAAPTAGHRTVVNTSTGLVDYYLWDWGDGAVSLQVAGAAVPSPHLYAVDGTYVIRLIAVGPGGVDEHSDSEVVNVP